MFAVLSTILLAYWHADVIRAIPTKNRLLHFYSQAPTTWNDANVLCQKSAMTLLEMDTEDVLTALKMFAGNGGKWDGIFDDFWTGLQAYGDHIGPDDYVWSTCKRLGSYKPWRLAYDRNELRCVRGKADLTPGDSWETTDCSKVEGKVICQKVKDECSFRRYSNRNVRIHSNISEMLLIGDTSLCRSACLTWKNSPECFGFYHKFSTCHLFLGESYTQMAGPTTLVASPGTTTYLKFCFTASFDSGLQLVSVFNTQKDVYPHTGCNSTDTSAATTSPATTTMNHAETAATITAESTNETNTSAESATTTINHAETTTIVIHAETATTITAESTNETNTSAESATTKINYAETTTIVIHAETATTITADSTNETNTSADSSTMTTTATFEEEVEDSKTPLTVAISTIHDKPEIETTTQPTTFVNDPTAAACECLCRIYPNLTDEEKRDLINSIITNLTIDPSQVSANRRKYISIDDPRPSVKAVGGSGIALLLLAFGGVFFLDAAALGKDAILLKNMFKCLRKR